jgi:DNA-binding HxlR family transcriptional regulator
MEKKFELKKDHEKYLKAISKNGLLPIFFILNEQPLNFSKIMFEVKLNPGVVDRQLKTLIQYKLVERKGTDYYITEKGRKVLSILEEIFRIIGEQEEE